MIWSAPAERSGDGALDGVPSVCGRIQSAVGAALCRRTPKRHLTLALPQSPTHNQPA
jgi:hypothetical protein